MAAMNGNGSASHGPIHVEVKRKIFPAVGDREAQLVLRDVEFDVAPRSFLVITGPSGCGKSTLLNIIAGLDTEYEGSVDLGAAREKLTYIFQTPRLLPWRTVYENIELVLPDGEAQYGKIMTMLERVGLAQAANAYPERLSLGMQRRAALARGFILEPEILLMDEPFVSLDDPTAESLRELLMELWHGQPTTVIFITHDRAEAIQLGTRILRLSPGKASVVQDAKVTLSDAQRRDKAAVLAEQMRIFASN
jgi:NitT/TauT family transport system ATP-binding protein